MSLFREEHLECPYCYHDVLFTLYSSINVGLHPELKEKVLDYSIFKYQCPHCKKSDIVCHPVLYHDPENKIMIQVLWHEEEFGRPVEKELQTLIELMGQKNYRRREVFGYCELVEKICIFDEELSDFAITLLKTEHKIKRTGIKIFFVGRNGEDLCFAQWKDGELLPNALIFPVGLYEAALQYAEQWQKPHEFYEYLRVNESYFHDELMELLNRKSPKNE